ncbi:MAG: hypothetical protein DWG82_03945 [Chloroflexi bacterium]|nr:hypothetical protein [Chloroflexota bacterium]
MEAALALFLAFRLATILTRALPLRISYAVGRGAGIVAFYTWPGGRRRSIQNLMRVTDGDEGEARRLARASFANYVVYLVDFFRSFATDPDDVHRRVRLPEEIWERLRGERRGNGIVFMTMHFGNWDMGAAILALHGFPISAVADQFANERLNRLIVESRRHLGMNVIPAGRTGPGILRALRNNDVVALLVDVPQQRGGVEVEFFGETIAVPDGPARIALSAGSSVVAALLPRVSPWSDQVGAQIAAVPYTATGDRDADVRGLTQAVFGELEAMIRQEPDQWYIFRHLWVADRQPAST